MRISFPANLPRLQMKRQVGTCGETYIAARKSIPALSLYLSSVSDVSTHVFPDIDRGTAVSTVSARESRAMDVKTRTELPIELYTHILTSLPPGDASTVKTLLSFFAANKLMHTIASASVVWKPVYEVQYTQCVPENEAQRRAELGDSNFYKLFRRRHEIDRRALALVDEIRLNVEGRSARARVLAREYSFDVWEALRVESVLPLPKYFRSPQDKAKDIEPAPHAFPRRYWARAVQGVIARYWAVDMWKRVVAGDQNVTFEELLMGFSAFFGWSPQAVSECMTVGLNVYDTHVVCRAGCSSLSCWIMQRRAAARALSGTTSYWTRWTRNSTCVKSARESSRT